MTFNYSFSQSVFLNTKNGKEVSIDELAKNLSKEHLIFFGEFHDDSTIHSFQNQLFQLIYQYNKNLSLSMEMFERDVQPLLNEYLNGKISNEEFLKNSRPWPDYQKFYMPMVEFAKNNKLDVLAANIPRKYAAQFVKEGMTGIKKLPPNEKSMIAKDVHLKSDRYLENFLETMLGSANEIDSLQPNEINILYLYYGSQVIKDETMAESIANLITSKPNNLIFHLNGDFHSNMFLGTVQKVIDRIPGIQPIVISPVYYKDKSEITNKPEYKELANYILFVPAPMQEEEPMGLNSGSHFGENSIINHKLNIDIEPNNSFIKANDQITFKYPILKTGSIDLLNTLKITKIEFSNLILNYKIEKLNNNYNRIVFTNPTFDLASYGDNGIKETSEFTVFYEGKIYNKPDETTLIQRHSNSIGIISDKEGEGIYLPGAAYYPKTENEMANFECNISIPSEYTLVSSFIKKISSNDNITNYSVKSNFPIDDLTIVGGRLKENSKKYGNFTINMFTYQDLSNIDTYFSAIKGYYDYYTNLFGDYPFDEFSVVENFFATGFGMPNYTLLSGRLLKMPWVVLSPGSIAHEFVHNWWGNSVFVDYNKGNWCESLTTFSTNYYYNALLNNEAGLVDWRKKALIEIDALPAGKNYPVRTFKYQSDIFDATIGYQKGAFIFIEIMNLMGKDVFFDALKSFATKNKGKKAYWSNLANEFDIKAKADNSPYPIKKIFNQWLDNKNLPEYHITRTLFNTTSKSRDFTITINAKNFIQSKLPIVFEADGKSTKEYMEIKDSSNTFTFKLPENCKEIKIDPDYECLRKVYSWEKPFNFNRTLNSNPIIVIPDKNSSDYSIAIKFVDKLKESGYNFDVIESGSVNDDLINNNSLILLGNFKNNNLINSMKKKITDHINIDDNQLIAKDKSYPINKVSALINIDHPNNPDKLCSIFYYNGLPDEKMLTRYFHYMSYSFLALEIDNPRGPLVSGEIMPDYKGKKELRIMLTKLP